MALKTVHNIIWKKLKSKPYKLKRAHKRKVKTDEKKNRIDFCNQLNDAFPDNKN